MLYVKCDKTNCIYNYSDVCKCRSIEIMNNKCLEYIDIAVDEEDDNE